MVRLLHAIPIVAEFVSRVKLVARLVFSNVPFYPLAKYPISIPAGNI